MSVLDRINKRRQFQSSRKKERKNDAVLKRQRKCVSGSEFPTRKLNKKFKKKERKKAKFFFVDKTNLESVEEESKRALAIAPTKQRAKRTAMEAQIHLREPKAIVVFSLSLPLYLSFSVP